MAGEQYSFRATQAGVTSTRPFQLGTLTGSLGMRLVCPDFPKKGKENPHPQRLTACQVHGWVPTSASKDPRGAEQT